MAEPRSDGGIGKVLPLLVPCAALVGLDSLITVPLILDIVRQTAVAPNLGALLVTAYAFACPDLLAVPGAFGRDGQPLASPTTSWCGSLR